jgi:hypothetical protein
LTPSLSSTLSVLLGKHLFAHKHNNLTDVIASDELEAKVYDDMDPVMSYLPSQSAWGVNRLPMFQDGTIQFVSPIIGLT